MEFDFSLSAIFGGGAICMVDKNLLASRVYDRVSLQSQNLCEVIDRLGAASAKAQSLPAIITTSSKLAYTDQRIYIFIQHDSDGSRGKAVGFIKVGTKKLFLYDTQGAQKEVSPLCVLDFYVHESQQRKGFGKKLYEHMLQVEGVTPLHLAVDKPSDKFRSFLVKHYKLRATIPQVNNYVIFEGFFNANKKALSKKRPGRPQQSSPELASNPMANRSTNQQARSPVQSANRENRSHVQARDIANQLVRNHSSGSSSPAEELALLSDIPLARPSSREKLVQSRHSPVTQPAHNTMMYNHPAGGEPAAYNPGLQQQNRVPDLHATIDHLPDEMTQLAVSNASRSQSAQNKAFSRHTTTGSTGSGTAALPHQYQTSNRSDYREPTRSRYGHGNVIPTDKLNSHQHTLNQQGHLKVTSAAPVLTSPHKQNAVHNAEKIMTQDAGDWSRTFHSAGVTRGQSDSSWNVFGVPLGYNHIANRRQM